MLMLRKELMAEIKKGLAIHCHHDTLVEFCYDYDKRVEYIRRDKPKNEQEIRLRLFKILSESAVKEIPEAWLEVEEAWREAEKARRETYKAWREAEEAWRKADAAWPQESKDAFHKKWCGCSEWNGKELVRD